MEAILHNYHPKRNLLLLEYPKSSGLRRTLSSSPESSVLLFVGGLYDDFKTPGYVDDLAALFPAADDNWSVMHVQLSTAGRQWGLYDLNRDVEELSVAVSYIRNSITKSHETKVVLMGFSTGCQDLSRSASASSRAIHLRRDCLGAQCKLLTHSKSTTWCPP
jgi:hypothetical protein